MSQHLIRGTSFDGESGGVVIEYLTPTEDVRANGLVINHALLIPAEEPFEDLLEELQESVQRALSAALTLYGAAPPLLVERDEDDDEPAPYDNPTER